MNTPQQIISMNEVIFSSMNTSQSELLKYIFIGHYQTLQNRKKNQVLF